GTFKQWLAGRITGPYNSWGNGSAMRVSPIAWTYNSEKEVLEEAEKSAAITHNHAEGIKGAQAIAMATFLARTGHAKNEIKEYVSQQFSYNLERRIDQIRPNYAFDVSCQGSVPESIIAFLESENFVDAIRLAISIGGDSDTIACMAGAIAHAYYQEIPHAIIKATKERLPKSFNDLLATFEQRFLTIK
ncbi:MAG: ADP-ribosylglycohydrolase family protein, partial [Bacteroidota bacterium]